MATMFQAYSIDARRRCTKPSTSILHILTVDNIKMKPSISILISPLDSMKEKVLFNNFGRSVVRLYCKLLARSQDYKKIKLVHIYFFRFIFGI